MQKLVETTAPAAEPLTLDEVKLHLRVSTDTDDALISTLIAAARMMCESYTGLALISRQCSLYLDCWPAETGRGPRYRSAPGAIKIPLPPLSAVAAINIYDENDTATPMDAGDYIVDAAARPGRIVLSEGASPPEPGRAVNGIEVQFTAGYGAEAADVPALLRLGMKQLAGWLYAHRGDAEAGAPEAALTLSGASALFRPYRLMRLS
ncbi:MAG: hypothetical protein GC185_07660 [Alphaproteobacteria bacterium]|nr:hypothetical protein [Alphaproteobacteria bacterium]